MSFSLLGPDGKVDCRYTDSWKPINAVTDALQHGYFPTYEGVFLAATATRGLYLIIGVRENGTIEPTGCKLRKET